MISKRSSLGALSLLAGWTVASLIGWAAGLAGGMLLTLVAAKLPGLNEDRFVVYAILFSVGLATGVAQWLVMAPYLPKPSRWIWVTLSGYLLAIIVLAGANSVRLISMAGLWDDALLIGLLGAAIGTPQWLLLRRHYQDAGIWVLASAIGLLTFVWLTGHPAQSQGEFVISGTLLGTLAAAVPGAALVWLVRRPLAAGV